MKYSRSSNSGQKAEDLTEEQLNTAMGELGIEGQEPNDQEIAMLEAEDQQAQPSPDNLPASQEDMVSKLERLGTLKAQGLLTEEEFAIAKGKLLAG